jgi:hypothetical protein
VCATLYISLVSLHRKIYTGAREQDFTADGHAEAPDGIARLSLRPPGAALVVADQQALGHGR